MLLQRCVVVVVTQQRPSLSCGVVVPQHRRLLYDLFTRNYRVKRSAVQARLAQEFGDVSKAEVDRLFHVSDASGVELASASRSAPGGDVVCPCRSAAAATPGCGT